MLKGIFKAVWWMMKAIGSAIAWAGAHIVASTAIAAAIAVVAFKTDSDLLYGVAAVLFGAAVGGWVANSLGAWFGANAGAKLGPSSAVRAVTVGAWLISVPGMVINLIGAYVVEPAAGVGRDAMEALRFGFGVD